MLCSPFAAPSLAAVALAAAFLSPPPQGTATTAGATRDLTGLDPGARSFAVSAGGMRCGTPAFDQAFWDSFRGAASDCAYGSTNPTSEYDASFVYEIPVVVHIIQKTDGTGAITDAKVQSQIDILNEDFLALAGTNGANGNDCAIQFHLATVDPNGNATTGITRSTNNTWFNDSGSYWNTLAWDTNRYLNIYTNSAAGYLGYVPDLPQGGIVGSNADRVVILWSSFGRNGPIGPPYNQGRTTTHEVGHYFGLWHPFDGGCGSASACYTTGDRICDTNPESSPVFGCPGSHSSCGNSDPFHNYMDYSDDLCMEEFTIEQLRRMRCTIEFYRDQLPDGGGPDPNASFSATPTTGDAPLLVAFTDESTGTGISAWSWVFGDGGTSTLQNPAYSYQFPGTYTVSLTVTGTNGTDIAVRTGYIEVTTSTNASVSTRNGSGVNPVVFTTVTLPVLGTTWTSQIDGGSLGASGLTFVVGYSAPLSGAFTPYGELLIDVTSPWLMTSIAGGGGGISTHNVGIPNDPTLLGFPAYTQGFLNSVGSSSQLTNALDLILGN